MLFATSQLAAAARFMVKDGIEPLAAKSTASIVHLKGEIRVVTPFFCNVIPCIAGETLILHVCCTSILALDAWTRGGLATRQTTGVLEDDALSIVATQAAERLRP